MDITIHQLARMVCPAENLYSIIPPPAGDKAIDWLDAIDSAILVLYRAENPERTTPYVREEV